MDEKDEKRKEPVVVRIEGGSNIKIGSIYSEGIPAVDAKGVKDFSLGHATVVMPEDTQAPREQSPPPPAEYEPWYRQFWWLVIAALLAVPGGLLVAYLQHWFGWNK